MILGTEFAIAALLVIGGAFGLTGSLGLLKLPTPMMRLHAPTKASTLGVGGILIASMLYSWAFLGVVSFHELLITLLLFLTAPVTALFIAKAHIHRPQSPSDLPPTASGLPWAGQQAATDAEPPRPTDTPRA